MLIKKYAVSLKSATIYFFIRYGACESFGLGSLNTEDADSVLIILMEGTVTPVHPPGVQMSCQTGNWPFVMSSQRSRSPFSDSAERVNTQHPTSPIPPACTLLHTLGQRRLAHGEETCTHMCRETTAEELLYLRLKDKMLGYVWCLVYLLSKAKTFTV